MKTKTFTAKQVAQWMVTFSTYNTRAEYQNQLHAIRCMFDANNDSEFWNEVCEHIDKIIESL